MTNNASSTTQNQSTTAWWNKHLRKCIRERALPAPRSQTRILRCDGVKTWTNSAAPNRLTVRTAQELARKNAGYSQTCSSKHAMAWYPETEEYPLVVRHFTFCKKLKCLLSDTVLMQTKPCLYL